MCKRPFQQFPVFEMMPENLFEYFDLRRDRRVEAMAARRCSKIGFCSKD